MKPAAPVPKPWIIVVVVVGVTAVAAVGLGWFRLVAKPRQVQAALDATRSDLVGSADTLDAALSTWVRERHRTLELTADYPAVLAAFDSGDGDHAFHHLADVLERVVEVHEFRALAIVDKDGRVLIARGDAAGSKRCLERARALLGDSPTTDFRTIDSDGVVLISVAPVAGGRGWVVGVDRGQHRLEPLLRTVNSHSRSAMLARADGGETTLLAPLGGGAGLTILRRPWIAPLSSAAGDGTTALVELEDYRSEAILATVRTVEGTPWTLLVKVDRADVLGPARAAAWAGTFLFSGWIAALLAVLVSAGIGLIVRGRRREAAAEARWGEVFDLASDAIFYVRTDGRIARCNARAEVAYGWGAKELIGLPVTTIRPPDNHDEVDGLFERLREHGSLVFETVHRRRDGSTFPVEVSASQVAVGGETMVLSIVRDLTERHAAEERIRAERERFAALIDASPLAIMTIGRDRRLTLWNAAAERIFGWRADEVLGRELPFVPEESRAESRALIERVLNGVGFSGYQALRRRKDGTSIEIQISTAPMRDVHGEIFALMAVCADRSESALLEAELRQAQKLEAVGRLAGGVAHDFNNLLTAIVGYGQMAQADLPADDRRRGYLDEVLHAAERAADLTRQLLAFSRKRVVSPGPVRVDRLVESFAGLLRRLIGDDVKVDFELASGTGVVLIDSGQLEQVLMNLCINARDAMPEGGTLTISVDEGVADSEELDRFGLASAGPYVRLAVADTGHGIPEEVRERLFEPFFTTKEVGKGTGLGLSTVYGIVREAGGAIAVDSTPGAGARFSVYLPVGQAADVRVPSTGEPAGLGGSETLLVVEDDASLRLLLREALNERGYRVHEAAEGGAALRILDDPPQDLQLLIVDSTLPGAGGAEVASRFMAQIEGLRVLLVSGYPSEALLDLAESVPGVEFLQKPFSPATLLRRVRQLLDRPVSEDRVAGSP